MAKSLFQALSVFLLLRGFATREDKIPLHKKIAPFKIEGAIKKEIYAEPSYIRFVFNVSNEQDDHTTIMSLQCSDLSIVLTLSNGTFEANIEEMGSNKTQWLGYENGLVDAQIHFSNQRRREIKFDLRVHNYDPGIQLGNIKEPLILYRQYHYPSEEENVFAFPLPGEDKARPDDVAPPEPICRLCIGDCISNTLFTGVAVQMEIQKKFSEQSSTSIYNEPISTDIIYCSGVPLRLSNLEDLSSWINLSTNNCNNIISLTEVCPKIEKWTVIPKSGVTGIDPIQADYCSHIGGRSLDSTELESLKKDGFNKIKSHCSQLWTTSKCEVIDLITSEVRHTCFPSNACFLCLVTIANISIYDYKLNERNKPFKVESTNGNFFDIEYSDQILPPFAVDGPDFNIFYQNEVWNLKFKDRDDSFFLMNSSVPFGLKSWNSSLAAYSQKFVIFSCIGQEMCQDGMCYNPKKSCNRKFDCKDKSDETYCATPYFRNPEYLIEDDEICDKYVGDYIMEVLHSGNITDLSKDEENTPGITIRAEIHLKWKDTRLIFFGHGYKDSMNGNELPFHPGRSLALSTCSSRKKLKFKILQSSFSSNLHIHRDFKIWGTIHGKEVTISNIFTIEFILPCDFNYSYFPFGDQKCSFCLSLRNCNSHIILKQDAIWRTSTEGEGGVRLKQICPYSITNKQSDIQMDVILGSKYVNLHLLTSFAPTFLMCLVAYITLFISIENIGERLSMSSGALLALAVHYSTVSENIVKTHEIKLIDWWFIGCMALTTLIVLINAILPYMDSEWALSAKVPFFRKIFGGRSNSYTPNHSMELHLKEDSPRKDMSCTHESVQSESQECVQKGGKYLKNVNFIAQLLVFIIMAICFFFIFIILSYVHVYDEKCS